jgi:hypothetical protein
MRVLLHPLFWGSVGLFLLHQLLQKAGIHHWLPDSYLDDLLCLPVVLTLALAFMRLVKGRPNYQLSFYMVSFAVLQVVVVFEFLLPRWSDTYHGDAWDVPVYIAGAAIWWFTVNRAPRK